MKKWLLALVMVFSMKDVRDRECGVVCKWAGYDGGVYAEVQGKTYCHCIDAKDYTKVVRQDDPRTLLPGRTNPPISDTSTQ